MDQHLVQGDQKSQKLGWVAFNWGDEDVEDGLEAVLLGEEALDMELFVLFLDPENE